MCWESRDINPVDSYTVELSKLTDEENGDTITEWVTILLNPWPVELKPFQVMWHQIALRKDSWPFGEFTFINISLSKINCIKLMENDYTVYGRRAETNVKICIVCHRLLPLLLTTVQVKCCWWVKREADHIISYLLFRKIISKAYLCSLPCRFPWIYFL